MYNDKLKDNISKDLESKVISIVNTSVALASQGYIVNKSKQIRLDWSSLLIHAFDNINVLSKEQQSKIELLYGKLNTI